MSSTRQRPARKELAALAAEAADCQACDLYRNATQTVFGRGPAGARLLLVGEQPGDREDREGEPFVGPAGRILTKAMADAGLNPEEVYVTNAVKHFKWTPRGKRRIHEKPSAREVVACNRWLSSEITIVDPLVIVILGATAGQALFGSKFRVGAARGETLDLNGRTAVATIHPSAVLRVRAPEDRDPIYAGLVADLRRAGELVVIQSG